MCIKSMVENWNPALGPRDLSTPSTSGSHGPQEPPGPLDLWTPWDFRTLEPLGNYLYRLKFGI